MELKNYMECLVWECLDEVAAGYEDLCRCEQCRYDIAALALNLLPPRYVVTERGRTWAKVNALDQQFYVDIVSALTNAVAVVRAKPHHRHCC